MERIIIVVEGGLIQEMIGIKPGTIIEVHDYDCEGEDEDDPNILKDENGDIYRRGLWTSDDYVPDSDNGPR